MLSTHTWLHLRHYHGNHAHTSAILWLLTLCGHTKIYPVRFHWISKPLEVGMRSFKLWLNNMIWIAHELLYKWMKSFPHTSSIFYIPFLPRLRSISLEKFSVKTCSTSCARPGCRVRVRVRTATSPKNLECTCCSRMSIYREACSACCRQLLVALLSPPPIISLFSACLILVTITTCISELNPSTPPHTRHVNISVNKITQALNLFCLCLEWESVSICTSAFSEAFFWTDVISCY